MNTAEVNIPMPTRQAIWAKWQEVAPPRMVAFGTQADTCPLDPAWRYVWNARLNAALMPSLHVFEVCFRNAVHQSLATKFGRQDWYDIPNMLLPRETNSITDARDRLTRLGRQIDPGRIVAEQTFGFWCNLFNKPYEKRIFRSCYSTFLVAFPAYLQHRSVLRSKLEEFRILRNRVFHHEPIWSQKGIDAIEAELWSLSELLYPTFTILLHDHANFEDLYLREGPQCAAKFYHSLEARLQNGDIKP